MAPNRLVNRNVTGATGRTSIRLEPEFWSALGEYCARERTTTDALVRAVDLAGGPGGRTSDIRVRLVRYFREAATEEGHLAVGHGQPGRALTPPS